MTGTTEAPIRGALGIFTKAATARRPFWHRDEPLVAITRIDPGHERLRHRFPGSWPPLLRLKALLDGAAALDVPSALPHAQRRAWTAPLLTAAAAELRQFAAAERDGGGDGPRPAGGAARQAPQAGEAARQAPQAGEVARQADEAATRLLGYVVTGEWPQAVLTAPRPGSPWLYCGPLNTWAGRAIRDPLGLLLVEVRPDLQRALDYLDGQLPAVRGAVEAALGGPVVAVHQPQPTMHVGDLLLVGGEAAVGHKNFAHFVPLETPSSATQDAEFTVVFGNVHADRLQRCSVPLLRRHCGRAASEDAAEQLLPMSIQWFRGHDLAHFWRRSFVNGPGAPLPSLTPFERMALEETYADTLGLISTTAVLEPRQLGDAFAAEMLRYLSRDHRHFADSAGAVLMLGWLHQRGRGLRSDGGEWLTGSLPALAELAVVLHGLLWEQSDRGLDETRSALADGLRLLSRELEPLYCSVPTDVDYTFG